jgi:hypothetical protein
VSPNREMVAYGLANMVGSFFGCYPAFGSFTRSSLADSAGAKSLVYSAVTLIIIVLALYLLGPMFAYMPKVVGSAVIFVAALNIFELHDIKFLWEMRSYAGCVASARARTRVCVVVSMLTHCVRQAGVVCGDVCDDDRDRSRAGHHLVARHVAIPAAEARLQDVGDIVGPHSLARRQQPLQGQLSHRTCCDLTRENRMSHSTSTPS